MSGGQDGSGTDEIKVMSPKFGPPLMLISPQLLRPEARERIKEFFANWDGKTPVVLDGGVRIFQYVDDIWREV